MTTTQSKLLATAYHGGYDYQTARAIAGIVADTRADRIASRQWTQWATHYQR
jgi:hypothetical protein